MAVPARRAILGLVIVVGLGLRFWGLQFGFPHPFARTDEEVIVDVALGVLRDPNPHFFDWPTLFMYVTGGAYGILFAVERAIGGPIRHAAIAKSSYLPVLHLTARTLSALAGSLTIVAVYAAARELFSTRAAVIAAGFLAVAYLHVRDSHFGVTDVPATFLVMCAFWQAAICLRRSPTIGRLIIGGLLCGLATATKYNAAVAILPILAALAERTDWTSRASATRAVSLAAIAIGVAAATFVLATPYAILDRRAFVDAVLGVRSHLERGHVVMASGWTYHATFTLRYGLGVPLMIVAGGGIAWALARQWREALLLLAFALPYYAILGSGRTVFARYMLPLVPFVCIAAAVAVDRIGTIGGRLFRPHHAASWMASALAVVIALPTLAASIKFDRLMSETDTRVLAADWIASRFPSGASIYQTGFGSGHVQMALRAFYPQFQFNETANRFEFNGKAAADPPEVIVVQDAAIWAYAQRPAQLSAILSDSYSLATSFVSVPAERAAGAIYDQEDAFYAPYAGIDAAERPGPTLTIYERRRPVGQ